MGIFLKKKKKNKVIKIFLSVDSHNLQIVIIVLFFVIIKFLIKMLKIRKKFST